MAYSLLKSEALKFHLYNFVPGMPTLEHFHQFYCEYQDEQALDLTKRNFKPLGGLTMYCNLISVSSVKPILTILLFRVLESQRNNGRWDPKSIFFYITFYICWQKNNANLEFMQFFCRQSFPNQIQNEFSPLNTG